MLQKENSSKEERQNASEIAKNAVNSHYALVQNKTPKVHVAEAHAVPQFMQLEPGLMRLLVEHWVERNHQDASLLEKNFSRTRQLKSKANSIAAHRHAENNSQVKTRIFEVNKAVQRGIQYEITGKYARKRTNDDTSVTLENRVLSEGTSPPPSVAGLPRAPAGEEQQGTRVGE